MRNTIIFFILPILGAIFYYVGVQFKQGYSNKKINIITFILIVCHELIQIYLNYIYDKPYSGSLKNTHNSFIGNLMDVNIKFYWLVAINIALLIILNLFIYVYINNYGRTFWNCSFTVCINAGLICSLIDKVCFKGSCDFIAIMELYMVDIKDIYIIMSILLFICEIILNERAVKVITK